MLLKNKREEEIV